MATTLVGIFDDYADAQQAVADLTQAGIKQGDISIARNNAGQGYETYGGANSKDYTTGTGIGDKISNFFDSIFGSDDDGNDRDERGIYSESVRRGSTVVAARVEDDAMVDDATDILNDAGAIDVDRRHAQYRAAGYTNYDESQPPYSAEQSQAEFKQFADEGEIALPVIEEELQVGKRVVRRGGVRVHTRVTERPIEETVNLREENVRVERRPVDRAVSEADLNAVKEGEFTITERAEEAVVGKEARVVEEVVVGKDVTEREETVRETVKRTDVEVEETDAETTRGKKARG